MRRTDKTPMAMGAMLGAMALWMLHGTLTGSGGSAGFLFVLAHVAAFIGAGMGVAFGFHRRWAVLARLLAHRPTKRHFAVMAGTAVITASVIHVIHGAPTWT